MIINANRNYCYRITHIQNLPQILTNGLVNKHHANAGTEYVAIGNPEIIDVRSNSKVKLNGYGYIGDYVPFYFTPKSIMLFNILTGYWHPTVPKRHREEIIVIRCLIDELVKLSRWFFTDGQANVRDTTDHYNDLECLNKIDWANIQNSNFSKSDGDYDRPRRYQAEFLVHQEVPVKSIESINVYNSNTAHAVDVILKKHFSTLAVNIQPAYFF